MTATTDPPFRADHVGSLLRPKTLTAAFKAHGAGEIDDDAFRQAQDDAIRDVIRLQEEAGLKSVTDGEFRRASYWGRFVEKVDGLEVRQALFTFHDDHGHETEFTAPHVAAKVVRNRPIALDELTFLKATTRETAKLTLPSPPSMHFWRLDRGVEPAIYDAPRDFFADLAVVYVEEIEALAAAGATYLQFDDVPLAMLCDPAVRARVEASGSDPQALIDDYIALFNACVASRPAAVSAAVHLCRGNYKGQFLSEGGYEEIAERLFNELEVDAFFLEYDTPRAGDFAPLRFVPKDRIVVLGLVSSKLPELESVDHLAARIDQASRHIPLAQLALSPQCGFASTVAGNPVTVAVEKAKLARIVETADKVWGGA